ncbi:biogenesis of lysosomal organelles complex 1 subunit pallidin [Haematobia irritans]|uniref:biogenesis of lysosomal organelles complex 1 subunit pallidin n=1 Tax=Haematobia irritans TaxID=7368 RepID=UPI003F5059A6
MLKSNNQTSILDDLQAFSQQETFEALRPTTLELETTSSNIPVSTFDQNRNNCSNNVNKNDEFKPTTSPNGMSTRNAYMDDTTDSLAARQLSSGFMQSFSPPLTKARTQLKELIGKQNKIYIDLSAEKFKLDNGEVAKLHDMMNDVKLYREKLLKIKKQMQNIYQRTKVLKKRAQNIQTSKEKELQRKLQKRQLEEALIAKQQTQQ